jgi:glycerophosphoryl diester phosphodiesterase
VRIIAHRGASAAAPENTLAAFALAKRLGADAVELDARVCGSGEVVVFHDRDLSRLTGAKGEVAATPLGRLRELRVLGEERIPTLEEVLDSDERPPGLVIELKTDRWNDVVIAAKVAKLIARAGKEAHGPVTVSSFNPLALTTLRRIAPHIARALLAQRKSARPLRNLWFARAVGPRELHLEASLVTPKVVAKARRAGRFVVAWTVNDAAEASRLEYLGVDGVITDVPDAIARGRVDTSPEPA